eukprot:Clim_evm15s159 gene=Clim_evmTU15s159
MSARDDFVITAGAPGRLSRKPKQEPDSDVQPEQESTKEDRLSQLSKAQILKKIEALDSRMTKISGEIEDLDRDFKGTEDDVADLELEAVEAEETQMTDEGVDIAEKILGENSKKAKISHDMIKTAAFPVATIKLAEMAESYLSPTCRNHLLFSLFRKKRRLAKKEARLRSEFKIYDVAWKAKIKKMEEMHKRSGREARVERFLDQEFPEMARPSTSDPSRQRHWGDAVRSEAEMEQIMQAIMAEQNKEERWVRTLIGPDPMIMDEEEKQHQYYSTSNKVSDPMAMLRIRKNMKTWSASEKKNFVSKYLLFPKAFGKIASFLPNKSACDCVLFYYNSKKKYNYKKLLRQHQLKRRRNVDKDVLSRELASLISESKLDGDQPSARVKPARGPPKDRNLKESAPPAVDEQDISATARWTEDEIQMAVKYIGDYGRSWNKISRLLGTKTPAQCKNFYHNYKKKYNLHRLAKGKDAQDSDEEAPNTTKGRKPKGKEDAKEEKAAKPKPKSKGKTKEEHRERSEEVVEKDKKDRKGQSWSKSEKETFVSILREHGKDWGKLEEAIPMKSRPQLRNFFQNYKQRMGLQDILDERHARLEKAKAGPVDASKATTAETPNEYKAGKDKPDKNPVLWEIKGPKSDVQEKPRQQHVPPTEAAAAVSASPRRGATPPLQQTRPPPHTGMPQPQQAAGNLQSTAVGGQPVPVQHTAHQQEPQHQQMPSQQDLRQQQMPPQQQASQQPYRAQVVQGVASQAQHMQGQSATHSNQPQIVAYQVYPQSGHPQIQNAPPQRYTTPPQQQQQQQGGYMPQHHAPSHQQPPQHHPYPPQAPHQYPGQHSGAPMHRGPPPPTQHHQGSYGSGDNRYGTPPMQQHSSHPQQPQQPQAQQQQYMRQDQQHMYYQHQPPPQQQQPAQYMISVPPQNSAPVPPQQQPPVYYQTRPQAPPQHQHQPHYDPRYAGYPPAQGQMHYGQDYQQQGAYRPPPQGQPHQQGQHPQQQMYSRYQPPPDQKGGR